MKYRTVLLVLPAIFLIISSCKKPGSYSYGTITATINGAPFKSYTVGQATVSPDSGQHFYEFGAVDSLATLDFNLPVLTMGTYFFGLSPSSPNITYYTGSNYYSTVSPADTPTTGSIIIASTGKNSITGTFSGVLYNQNGAIDSVIITYGVFTNCSY